MHNAFKQDLQARRPQSGLWMSLSCESSVEIASLCGADWLLIDMEHSPNEAMTVMSQLRAAVDATRCVVRPPCSDPVITKRLLDIGARNLMFPMIETAEQAREVVSWTRYPPSGIRGISGVVRANGYGTDSRYLNTYADELTVIVQVESPEAIRNIPEIAAVEGIDSIFIGPGDLMASLGKAGAKEDAEHARLIEEGLKSIRDAGIAAGILGYGAAKANAYFTAGFDYVAIGADTWMLVTGFKELFGAIERSHAN
ncbi:aldolase/citrate lyase family protein [Salinicola sp. 4072]|uniref:HpcH/HpaI aldolase family protein n=1 Tax=Salinicola sp. 4072 TaxID=3082157 RepID=UPI002FCA632F